MNQFFRRIDKTFTFIEDGALFLSVAIALVVAMANVILRKLTNEVNLYWSDEIVRKVIYLTTYFGCIAAIRNRSLIRIDALPQIFPVLKKPLSLLSHTAVLIFAGIMVWLGGSMTRSAFNDTYQRTASLQIPEWIFYLVLPVMGGMMFIRTIIIIIEELRERPESAKEKE
jgi:TRAP-type C4-dicarboxylate transport system permease small subunit